MPHDDLRDPPNWDKYQTLTLDRRDDGILLITITEPEGAAPATLVRRHTEISGIWRDFADDPELRVAVITGTGDHFWTVEGTDGIEEMLENPGDYNNVIHLIRETWSTRTASSTATSRSSPPSMGRPWGRGSQPPCLRTSASRQPTHG